MALMIKQWHVVWMEKHMPSPRSARSVNTSIMDGVMTDDTWYSDPTHMAVSKASAKLNWKPGDEKERAEDFTNTSYSMAG